MNYQSISYNDNQESSNKPPEIFQPFNQRTKNLDKFQSNAPSYRLNHYRNVLSRAKVGTLTSTSKSLDILRACLQESFNQEIDNLMQRYLTQYFKPAIDNIKKNNGENAISDQHLHNLFRTILEEAKKMYDLSSDLSKISTPISTISTCNLVKRRKRLNSTLNRRDSENNFNVVNNRTKQFTKRLSASGIEKKKIKQNESREMRKAMLKKRKLGNQSSTGNHNRGRPPLSNKIKLSKLVDLGEDNFNKDRITTKTEFVLGSKANKALGFGSARGRLYTKHTNLFRYIGDQEDKQYLHEKGLFPISGARAFLIIKEDIEKLLKSKEYLNVPGVNADEIKDSFTLPDWFINKIKEHMEKTKSEREKLSKSEMATTSKSDESASKDDSLNSFC